jgi:hypothetical protein
MAKWFQFSQYDSGAMKLRIVPSLSLICLVGCAANPHTATHATLPNAANAKIPLVYSSYLKAEPISDQRMAEMLSLAAQASSDPIWFAYVRCSNEYKYRVTIYYRPQFERPGIRGGHELFIDSYFLKIAERLRQIEPDAGPVVTHYVQLSQSSVASESLAIPIESEIPFGEVPGLSDAQLIRLVEVVRSAKLADTSFFPKDLPILRISEQEPGLFEVKMGWQADMLGGQGIEIKAQQSGDDFEVVKSTYWVS